MITTTESNPIVSCSGLELRPAQDGSVQIRPEDFQISAGEGWALVGPSGCGKTTLINALCGLLKPYAGSLHILNQDLYALSSGQRDRFRGKRLGVVHQDFYLLSGFTALENLTIALRYARSISGHGAKEKALHMLDKAGLGHRASTRVEVLSRGEAQRVAVTRALVHEPELLLTDEPTASLDPQRGEEMLQWIDELRSESNSAWICVTHDPQVADRFDHCLNARTWSQQEASA